MDEQIIDILGIGTREDSYTDLIAYAFVNNQVFRKNLLILFGEEDRGDWKVFVRMPVPIQSESGRKKDVPDLVLFSRKAQKVLLIENKIFSGEGWRQTERYASDAYKRSLGSYLVSPTLDYDFLYLTLDGSTPSSTAFKSISYQELMQCITQNSEKTKLDILLQELRERIEEYYNWPAPADDDDVRTYLKNCRRLVNSYRTFIILTERIFPAHAPFLTDWGITANRGSGYIPLYHWYKENWRGEEYPAGNDGSRCYDIHFELQWDTRVERDYLRLYLHYHTNPYMVKKEFETLSIDFIEGYGKSRTQFFNFLKDRHIPLWNFNKTQLSIADYIFDKNITFKKFRNIMIECIENMTLPIDAYFNT